MTAIGSSAESERPWGKALGVSGCFQGRLAVGRQGHHPVWVARPQAGVLMEQGAPWQAGFSLSAVSVTADLARDHLLGSFILPWWLSPATCRVARAWTGLCHRPPVVGSSFPAWV